MLVNSQPWFIKLIIFMHILIINPRPDVVWRATRVLMGPKDPSYLLIVGAKKIKRYWKDIIKMQQIETR